MRFVFKNIKKDTSSTSTSVSLQQGLPAFLHRVGLGGMPDGKAERDLAGKISEIADQIHGFVIHGTPSTVRRNSRGIDGPIRCYYEAHSVEGSLHMVAHLVASGGHLFSLAQEDLEEI